MSNQDNTFDDLTGWTIDQGCAPLSAFVDDEAEAQELIEGYARNLRRRFALVRTGVTKGEVWDMATNVDIPMRRFELQFKPWSVNYPGPNKGAKSLNIVDVWKCDPLKVVVDDFDILPGQDTTRIIERGHQMIYNLWHRPRFEVEPSEATISEAGRLFETFLAHLVPGTEERDWARNWVARKVQHPEERGIAFVHVTPTKGTGRGAFINLLTEMIGHEFHKAASSADIYGRSSSSEYRDYRGVLLLTLSEGITQGTDRGEGEARARELISSSRERMEMNPKGQKQVMATVYFSTFIASNDPHRAVRLDDSERRFCVIAGPHQKLEHNALAYKAVNELLPYDHGDAKAVKRSQELLAGLYEYLMSLETCGERFKELLKTDAYYEMLEGGRGPVELALSEVLEEQPEECDGLTLDGILGSVKRRIERRVPGNLKSIVAEALTNTRALPDGTVRRGFEGWVLLPRQAKVKAPEGTRFAKGPGFSPMERDDPNGIWRITGLVVREQYAEAYDGVVEDRGEIVSEMPGKVLGQDGKPRLETIIGGRA